MSDASVPAMLKRTDDVVGDVGEIKIKVVHEKPLP
jgi:hypothetical protein